MLLLLGALGIVQRIHNHHLKKNQCRQLLGWITGHNAWVLTPFPWGCMSSASLKVYFIASVLIYATPGCMPVMPPLQRLRQESGQFEAILGYIVLHLTSPKNPRGYFFYINHVLNLETSLTH